jgi:hypothetical protein
MMKDMLLNLERRARQLMIIVAGLMLLVLFCVKVGWISNKPSYKDDAWYAVNDRGEYVITTEYATETGCRAGNMATSNTCRTGRALSANAQKASYH